MTDALDGLLFTAKRDLYFNIVHHSANVYPRQPIIKHAKVLASIGHGVCSTSDP
jgi:hypothetical protein